MIYKWLDHIEHCSVIHIREAACIPVSAGIFFIPILGYSTPGLTRSLSASPRGHSAQKHAPQLFYLTNLQIMPFFSILFRLA